MIDTIIFYGIVLGFIVVAVFCKILDDLDEIKGRLK